MDPLQPPSRAAVSPAVIQHLSGFAYITDEPPVVTLQVVDHDGLGRVVGSGIAAAMCRGRPLSCVVVDAIILVQATMFG